MEKFNIIFIEIVIVCLLFLMFQFFSKKEKDFFEKGKDIKIFDRKAQLFLDKFFVNDKLFSFLVLFIYLILIVLIFVSIRYLFIGNITFFDKISLNTFSIYPRILGLFELLLFWFILLLYKKTITKIFFFELNKIYIYLHGFDFVWRLEQYIDYNLFEAITGYIAVFLHRVSTLTYRKDLYPLKIHGGLEYICENEIFYEIENPYLINFAYWSMDKLKFYKKLRLLLLKISTFFLLIHKNINQIIQLLPSYCLGFIFLMELYNCKFEYIYIYSLIFLILQIIKDLKTFVGTRSSYNDSYLAYYLYKNTVDYKLQRAYFYTDTANETTFFSPQNRDIASRFKLMITYIVEDRFKRDIEIISTTFFQIMKGYWYILFALFIIFHKKNLVLMIFSIKVPLYYLAIFLIIVGFINFNKKKLISIFLVSLTLLYMIIVFYFQIFFILNDTLTCFPISIQVVLTYEEKVLYFFQYLETFKDIKIGENLLFFEDIRYKCRFLNFENIFNENITIKDIQNIVKNIIKENMAVASTEKISFIQKIIKIIKIW